VAGATFDIAQRLNDRIADLARHFLGEPNRSLSTAAQLRFGSKGSVAVEIDGHKKGRWYDHEEGVGGDGLELVRRQAGNANGDAFEWARAWLGMSANTALATTTPPAPSVDTTDRTKDDHKAVKVAAVVANCGEPSGTCVELYLRKRGITVPTLPACIRFRREAFGGYHALVALATDADGAVHAVQQIYLTDDGAKAPVPVQKRTNKAQDGWSKIAPVRLPGEQRLILCEGVETALSLWQATGQEVWACLGIANMAQAPVPEGASIVVARDGDMPESKADRQLRKAVSALRRRAGEVAVASPPPGQDFNDVLRKAGERAVRDMVTAATAEPGSLDGWRRGLLLNQYDQPRAVLANAIHALRHAPEWREVLWHDAFATATVARMPPPWVDGGGNWGEVPWTDRDDALLAEWLQRQDILVPASVAGQAVDVVARDRAFHPVRDYLDGLAWDGVARLDTWLATYLGAEDADYVRAVGPRWLTSAVARVHRPGCKADCALVLEGPQGAGKSSALRALADPWFCDRLSELGSKDAAIELRGTWIVEIAELDSMSRAETGTIKAYMSRSHDRYRPPYGRRVVELPRQCVFAGSVNPEGGYLKDATGGRRFWPVACGAIDVEALARDRDQLWAEAVHRFHAGHSWWLDTPELEALAAEQQAERYQGDAWEKPIAHYLENETRWLTNGAGDGRDYPQPRSEPLNDVSVAEVLEHALAIEKGRWTQTDQNRVVRCLTSMGFCQYRSRRGEGRERRYRRHRVPGPGARVHEGSGR